MKLLLLNGSFITLLLQMEKKMESGQISKENK